MDVLEIDQRPPKKRRFFTEEPSPEENLVYHNVSSPDLHGAYSTTSNVALKEPVYEHTQPNSSQTNIESVYNF